MWKLLLKGIPAHILGLIGFVLLAAICLIVQAVYFCRDMLQPEY